MTATYLKSQIQKALENVPEHQLQHVLSYLQELQKDTSSESVKEHYLKKILTEDSELLKKLAQWLV